MTDRRIQRHPPQPGIRGALSPIPRQRPPDLKQHLLIKVLPILLTARIDPAKPQHPLAVLVDQSQKSSLQRLHSALVSRRSPERITPHAIGSLAPVPAYAPKPLGRLRAPWR